MAHNTIYLNLAAKTAEEGMKKGDGGPFGAVIVQGGRVVATACNTVLKEQEATRHAEMNAIKVASKKLGRFSLDDCDIYSTTEPCPMCFSAIHWARVRRVYYCTTIADVKRLGFNELTVSNQKMKLWGKSPVELKKVKNPACKKLLADWKNLASKQTY